MDDEKKTRLERLEKKYFLYLHVRDPRIIKWVYERHPGIATGLTFLSNEVERLFKEENIDVAQKAFEEFISQDEAARKLYHNFGGD